MRLGELIKTRRKDLGLTQVELARAAKITQGSLSLIERGNTHSLSGTTLVGLATALRLDPKLLAQPIEESLEVDAPRDNVEAVSRVMKALGPRSQALLRTIAEAILEQEHQAPAKSSRANADTRAKSAA